MQQVYFCLGTKCWLKKCPDISFANIIKIQGGESQYQGILGINMPKIDIKINLVLSISKQNLDK